MIKRYENINITLSEKTIEGQYEKLIDHMIEDKEKSIGTETELQPLHIKIFVNGSFRACFFKKEKE